MDVELTGVSPRSNQLILQSAALELLFNEPLTNGYRLKLKTGKTVQLPASATGYLLISLVMR
jgi:hypothetical protein